MYEAKPFLFAFFFLFSMWFMCGVDFICFKKEQLIVFVLFLFYWHSDRWRERSASRRCTAGMEPTARAGGSSPAHPLMPFSDY